MDYQVFIRGLIIGLSIAAPGGPIGVLCIRRTLIHGRLSGLLSGQGAATADAVCGLVAAFGITVISSLLAQYNFLFLSLGGLFLCLLGIKTFLSKPTEQACPKRGVGLIGAYGSTFLLTLTNPMTILSFAVIFASFGLGTAYEGFSAAWLLLWVLAGLASWWLVLSCTVAFAKNKMSTSNLMWINRTSGVVIFGFGVLSLAMLAL